MKEISADPMFANEFVAELKRMLKNSPVETPEELHVFSRRLMSSPRFLKGLGVTLARHFLAAGIRPTHVIGFEKWAGNPVGFIVAEWLSQGGPEIALRAAERRKPAGEYLETKFRPARYADLITAYFPLDIFSAKQNLFLFIDDVVDSASTMAALYDLAMQAQRAGIPVQVIGMGTLIARNAGLKRMEALANKKIPVIALTTIE